MSDDTNNSATVDPTGESDIPNPHGFSRAERLNAILKDRGHTEGASYRPSPSSVRYNGATGEVTVYSDGGQQTVSAAALEASAPQTPEELLARVGRLPDDPTRSLEYTWQGLVNQFKHMDDRYNAHTFDPNTGAKIYRLTSSERAKLHSEMAEFLKMMEAEKLTLLALSLQRRRDAALREQAIRDQVVDEEARKQEAVLMARQIDVEERARALLEAERKGRRDRGSY